MAARGNLQDRLKIFISYSRTDWEDAHQMVRALEESNFEVRIDTRDLPFGEAWQAELAAFIQEADTIIWLVSAKSVKSHWCNWELAQVIRMQKRFIPVVIGDVETDEIPKAIGDIHLLPVGRLYDEEEDLKDLIRALNTDRTWIRQHTRFTDRALEWVSKGKPSDGLLRGSQLKEAIAWRDKQPASAPLPGKDVLDLILQSQRASTQRQRLLMIGASILVLVLAGLSVFSFIQQQQAIAARNETAERSALLAAGTAESMADEGRTDAALLVLLEASQSLKGKPLSDRLRIAFTKTLSAAETVKTHYLPDGTDSFAVGSGIYTVSPDDFTLSRLESGALTPLCQLPGKVKMLGLGKTDTNLTALTEDWDIISIDTEARQCKTTGRMVQMADFMALDGAFLQALFVTVDGRILANAYAGIDDDRESKFSLADPETGKEIFASASTTEFGDSPDRYAHMPDGSIYLGSWNSEFIYRVMPDFTFDPTPIVVTEDQLIGFNAFTCIRNPDADFGARYQAYLDTSPFWQIDHQCQQVSGQLLISDKVSTSAGEKRTDLIVNAYNDVTDLDDYYVRLGRYDLTSGTGQNRDWVALSLYEKAFASYTGRDLSFFADDDTIHGYDFSWIRRAPYPLKSAAITGENEITAATSIRPMLISHTILPETGYGQTAIPEADREHYDQLSEASRECDTSTEDEPACTIVSPDGQMVVTVSDGRTILIGPDAGMEDGKPLPADGSLGEISVPANGPSQLPRIAARFSADNQSILALYLFDSVLWQYDRTDDGDWVPHEIYRGTKPLVDVQIVPGHDDLLVLTESLGSGEIRSFLWSLNAQMEWFEIGRNYKWLNVLPLEDGRIAFGQGAGWDAIFELSPDAKLIADAKALLSEACLPGQKSDYAASPCWPL